MYLQKSFLLCILLHLAMVITYLLGYSILKKIEKILFNQYHIKKSFLLLLPTPPI